MKWIFLFPYNFSHHHAHTLFPIPHIPIEFDDERDDIAWLEEIDIVGKIYPVTASRCHPSRFGGNHPVSPTAIHPSRGEFGNITFPPSPCDELHIRIAREPHLEVFPFFPEGTTFEDGLILEEEKGFTIADTKGTESIDDIDILESEICLGIEYTLDVDGFLRKILYIMDQSKFSIHHLFECFDLRGFDREASRLPMPSEPHEVFSTGFEEFDHIAPLRWPTGSDGGFLKVRRFEGSKVRFSIIQRLQHSNIQIFIHLYLIAFSAREWVIVSILEDNRWLIVHLSEFTSDETDHAMLEIMRIVEEDRFRGIDIHEGFFEVVFCGSLSCLIQVFELIEERVDAIFSCEEPLEGGDGGVHATCSIDTGSYLESYQIRIILGDPLASLEEFPESSRFRLSHLSESERHDRTILTYDRHAVRDRSEWGEVDVVGEERLKTFLVRHCEARSNPVIMRSLCFIFWITSFVAMTNTQFLHF